MKKLKVVVAAVAASTAVGGLAACGSSDKSGSEGLPKGEIKIGALFTLSGPSAAIGGAQKAAFDVLVGRLNAAGGIAGRKVKFLAVNDQGDPAVAVSGAKKLVDQGVAAVVYAGTSAVSGQTIPVLMKSKVPIVSLDSNTAYADPSKYPYMFTTYPSDEQTMKNLVSAAQSRGSKKLGIISDGLPYGDNIAKFLGTAAEEADLAVTKKVTYAASAVDVTSQLRQLKSDGADALAVLSTAGLDHVYDGLRTIGWTPQIFTTAVAYFVGYDSLGNLSGSAFANCNVPLAQGASPDAGTEAVLKAVSDKTGVTPSTPTAIIFNDDLGLVKAAIETSKSVDPDKMRAALEGMTDFSYTSPTYTYGFSASDHAGFPDEEVGLCRLKPLGPYDYPYSAD
ncbi:MAG: ABC transporter substrate-binding protein [Nocardioidaceae bacterium]|nr:ABC transporter substrate-binding protein [Nocardioidaceae bacterium]